MIDSVKRIIRFIAPGPVRFVGRFVGLYRWVYPRMRKAFWATPSKERRLLIIHDFSAQPFSVGELLVSMEGALVLRETHGLGAVDLAIVYDPQNPMQNNLHERITEKNVLFNLAALIPVAQVNPYFGSLFVFDSPYRLARFVLDNTDLYHVWPDAGAILNKKYLGQEIFNNILYPYFLENGCIPNISCSSFLVEWSEKFYRENVCPNVAITIQIRQNPFFHLERNLKTECWLEFFRYCESRYPVKFVLIGTVNEIDPCLRVLRNVIVAKDFHTGLDQDLALIQKSAIHMGASSGPACMALFSKKPYLCVPYIVEKESCIGLIKDGKFWRFPFSTPYQRNYPGTETTDLLIAEFERMWSVVDKAPWQKPAAKSQDIQPASWLR